MIRIEQIDALYPQWLSESFFYEGKLLRIDEVKEALEKYSAREGKTPAMLHTMHNARSRYPDVLDVYESLEPKRFPVTHLRHVTVCDAFMSILAEESIRGCERVFLLKGERRNLRVSCWGVHLAQEDVESAKKKRAWDFAGNATEWFDLTWEHLCEEEGEEVKDMLANSPAMREESRYGNFQFSFRIKMLLEMYRDQHCEGEKPVLRVLGTEAHTLEIVHWILIHSPGCKDFDHLPTVDPEGPFSRDGNLMWAPESMTDQFTWQISRSNCILEKKPFPQTHDPWVWNNPVFAFHLPGTSALWMGRDCLLYHVEACENTECFCSASSHSLRHPKDKYMCWEEAEAIIQNEKWY